MLSRGFPGTRVTWQPLPNREDPAVKSLNHFHIQGAVVLFLAAMMSGAVLRGGDAVPPSTVHSFVGTQPDATSVDVPPPTF